MNECDYGYLSYILETDAKSLMPSKSTPLCIIVC